MRVNLQVPYAEKDLARRRGARWDRGRKVWYVEDTADLGRFLRWMPRHLTKPHKAPEEAFSGPTSNAARAGGLP